MTIRIRSCGLLTCLDLVVLSCFNNCSCKVLKVGTERAARICISTRRSHDALLYANTKKKLGPRKFIRQISLLHRRRIAPFGIRSTGFKVERASRSQSTLFIAHTLFYSLSPHPKLASVIIGTTRVPSSSHGDLPNKVLKAQEQSAQSPTARSHTFDGLITVSAFPVWVLLAGFIIAQMGGSFSGSSSFCLEY